MAAGPARPAFRPGEALAPGLVLRLPQERRERLAAPFGDVFQPDELRARTRGARAVAAIGDITAAQAIRHGTSPHFIAVDFNTKRGPVAADDAVRSFGDSVERVVCPAGFMTADLYNAVLRAAQRKGTTRIEVEGEEDLAVMPAIMHLEAGATVLYGLPNRGITAVKVDDESRRVSREFLESFVVESP